MGDNYSDFVGQVMEYAVDSATEPVVRLGGKEVAKLDEDTFVDHLYVQWPNHDFEERLYEKLLASTQLTCVAAFRGCGKTSAIRHAISRVKREHGSHVAVVLIDVKKLYDAGVFAPLSPKPTDDGLANAYYIFKTEIRKVVQQRLLPGPDNTRKLLAWTLAGPPDDSDQFSDLLVASVIDLSDPVIVAADATKKTRRGRAAAIAHLLEDATMFTHYHAASILHIGTAHVVRAAMMIHRWRRVALVYDNIDRIPIAYQVKFMEAVNDTHNALDGKCGTVVAVRRETLRWPVPRPGEKGDFIEILAPAEAEYPVVLFPDTRPEHVSRILQARHDYSVNLYRTNAAAEAEVSYVAALHAGVVDEFINDSIYAMANGSIRALAKIYTGFFRYVHRTEHAGAMRAPEGLLHTDAGHLQTVFFLFLRENAREYGLLYYETLRSEADLSAAADVRDLASPHHLILTALYNLSRELRETGGGAHEPTFNQLWLRLAALGFRIDDIRGAVAELHGNSDDGPHTIEFVDTDPLIASLQPGSIDRMRLTPLGDVLVTALLHKVGYVWGQAYDSYVRSTGRREQLKTYYELSPPDRIRIFFHYVRDLMLSHLKMLVLVRKKLHPKHGKKWLETYRTQFALDNSFHVERLASSAAGFYAPHIPPGQSNPFDLLLSHYHELANEIDRGVEYGSLVTNKLMWRIEDYYTLSTLT